MSLVTSHVPRGTSDSNFKSARRFIELDRGPIMCRLTHVRFGSQADMRPLRAETHASELMKSSVILPTVPSSARV